VALRKWLDRFDKRLLDLQELMLKLKLLSTRQRFHSLDRLRLVIASTKSHMHQTVSVRFRASSHPAT
jgi:hypothetical protein